MDPALAHVVAGSLALLLAVSVSHKLRDLPAFVGVLREYRLLPEAAASAAAAAVVVAELGLAVSLVLPATRAPAAPGVAALLLLYAAAVAVNLARGRRHIDCGCTGPAQRRPLSGRLVARNAALAAAAFLLLIPPTPRDLGLLDGLSIGFAIAALALLHASAERLAELSTREAGLSGGT